MRRNWSRYINDQKYCECQLVTAINAYYFLTGKTVIQDSDEYEKLVDFCGARYGAAIRISKVYRQFGLRIEAEHDTLWEFGRKLPLPIEANLWHKRIGFHSTLIVDQCLKTKCLRLTNFKWITSCDGWIFQEDLRMHEIRAPMIPKYRLFGRVNKSSL